jgi:4-amino-4-deoxy-L-arabinose transferase-like glycosyltransferase
MSDMADNDSPTPGRKMPSIFMWIALITVIHASIWFIYYGQTELGESPALDNRQTLLLAEQMALGNQTPEPHHRAPLYPYILSLFIRAGLSFEAMPLVARFLNLAALLVISIFSAKIAVKLWKTRASAWIAGLATGLNPVFLFFAGDAFPIILATASVTLALHQLIIWRDEPSVSRSLLIGFWLTLGAALRSHIMCLALLWPIAVLIYPSRRKLLSLLAAALPVGLSFLALGFSNLSNSGEFRMMPWQGSFILWASNGPHAQGRIYTQQIRVDFGDIYDNPSKIESIELYERETGESPPHSISEMNAHWKNKTFEHIASHPVDWVLLMSRKAYYFLNNYEQYDNKTYGFHKSRHLQLRLNPIHWGALLILAVAGAIIGLTKRETRFFTISLIVIFALYAAGTILFVTSNRYRLPMIPALSILASGAICLPSLWSIGKKRWRILFVACILLTVGITYTTFLDTARKNTWEEDYALLANASLRSGRDVAAIEWAERSLGMNPNRKDMQGVLLQAHFNTWAFDRDISQPSMIELEGILKKSTFAAEAEPKLLPVIGIYEWKIRQFESAISTWQSVAATDALARLCLIRTGHAAPPNKNELLHYKEHPSYPLLLAFININQPSDNSQETAQFINALLSPAGPN